MPYAPLVTSIILISNSNYYFFHSYLNLTISLCKRSAVMPNVYKFNGQKRPTWRRDDCPISEYKPRESIHTIIFKTAYIILWLGWKDRSRNIRSIVATDARWGTGLWFMRSRRIQFLLCEIYARASDGL